MNAAKLILAAPPQSQFDRSRRFAAARSFFSDITVIYPSEHEIKEYFADLSVELKDEVDPFLEKGQKDYRRIWQQEPLNEDGRIQVLCRAGADVFKTRTVKRLRDHSGEFEAFQAAISLDGGEAELGFWCAHRLYNLVERGRMLAIWHREIQSHLRDRIREAENLWYTPELVPDGWAEFFGPAQPKQDAPAGREGTPPKEDHGTAVESGEPEPEPELAAMVAAADLRWEELEIHFLSEERVQITTPDRTETKNYAEMGCEDRRNGKPNEAWTVLRQLAENRGSAQTGMGVARSRIVKRMQELRKILRQIHPADGEPLVCEHGRYEARFFIGCRPSYRA